MNKTELILNDISNALYGLLDADALPNIMGEECPSISVKDMKSNMDVLSFEHSVSLWNVDNAPVGPKRFYDLLDVARITSQALTNK